MKESAICLRAIALLCLWILCVVAPASSAIILISPADAGPDVDPMTYFHPNWVLWPPATVEGGSNRLLSIMSGVDWRISGLGGAPVRVGGRWRLPSQSSLNRFGYFREVGSHAPDFRCLENPLRSIAPNALMLAARNEDPILAAAWSDRILPGENVVYEARTWDEVNAIEKRVSEGTLVLEYPPRPGQTWSRLWRFYRGRRIDEVIAPTGPNAKVRFPGVVRAANILNFFPTENSVPQRIDVTPYDDANRWLTAIQRWRPAFLGVWGALSLSAFIVAAIAIMREHRSRIAQGLLIASGTFVPAALLGSSIARASSLNNFFVLFGFVWVFSTGIALGVSSLPTEKLETKRLIGYVTAALFAAALSRSPEQSIFSGIFEGRIGSNSAEATGVFMGLFILWFLLSNDFTFRLLAAAVPVMATGNASEFGQLWLFSLAWVVTSFIQFRWWWLLPLIVEPWNFGQFVKFESQTESDALARLARNDYVAFIMSPAFIFAAGGALATSLFGDRFFLYQLRRLCETDSRFKIVGRMSLATVAVGATHPEWLHSALIAGLFGFGAIVFACVRDL